MQANTNLEVGQTWKYATRASDTNSTVTILKIEERNNSHIVHICVNEVMIKDEIKDLTYLPFNRKTLEESITELVSSHNELPEFEEGYEQWRDDFDKGEAGIFADKIKDIVNNISDML